MKNKKFYVDHVVDSASIRKELNEVHAPILGRIRKMFSRVFDLPPSQYTLVKDMRYYKGGFPNPDTPPRQDVFLDRVIALLKLQQILNDTSAVNYLKRNGIEVSVNPINILNSKIEALNTGDWHSVFDANVLMPTSVSEFFGALVDKGCEVQAVICSKADEIKITAAEQVEGECDIKRGHFVKAVNLQYKVDSQKKIDSDLQKVDDSVNSQTEAISIFRKEQPPAEEKSN